jgi:hypothetical protein
VHDDTNKVPARRPVWIVSQPGGRLKRAVGLQAGAGARVKNSCMNEKSTIFAPKSAYEEAISRELDQSYNNSFSVASKASRSELTSKRGVLYPFPSTHLKQLASTPVYIQVGVRVTLL